MTPQVTMDAEPEQAPQVAQTPRRYWLFRGPHAYLANTPWSPWGGAAATVGIFLGAVVAVGAVIGACALYRHTPGQSVSAALDAAMSDIPVQILATLMQQIAMIGLTWVAAASYGAAPTNVLSLRAPAQGTKSYALAFLLLVLTAFTMSTLIHLANLPVDKNDIKMFETMLQSRWSWLAIVMVSIGAPLSEELLCRGFLFSALAKSRLGTLGAALITSAGFASVHLYSPIGMIQVFVIGLLFAWVLIRTGSLRVTMVCHALFNTLQTALVLNHGPT